MEKESNKLYDVNIIKPEYLVDAFEDNPPIYLHITEEQLVLLRWLDDNSFLELSEDDLPPKIIDLAEQAKIYKERC